MDFKNREDYLKHIHHKKKVDEASSAEIQSLINPKTEEFIILDPINIELLESVNYIFERKNQESHRLRRSLYKKMGQQLTVLLVLIIKILYEFSGMGLIQSGNYSTFQRASAIIIFFISMSVFDYSRKLFYKDFSKK